MSNYHINDPKQYYSKEYECASNQIYNYEPQNDGVAEHIINNSYDNKSACFSNIDSTIHCPVNNKDVLMSDSDSETILKSKLKLDFKNLPLTFPTKSEDLEFSKKFIVRDTPVSNSLKFIFLKN